jgi:hypothetical protein
VYAALGVTAAARSATGLGWEPQTEQASRDGHNGLLRTPMGHGYAMGTYIHIYIYMFPLGSNKCSSNVLSSKVELFFELCLFAVGFLGPGFGLVVANIVRSLWWSFVLPQSGCGVSWSICLWLWFVEVLLVQLHLWPLAFSDVAG